MIFVTLGTQDKGFPRLLEAIDKQIEKGNIKEKVIVQAGLTEYESKNMEIFDLVPQKDFDKYVDEASLIITHGGAGSIIMALNKHKKVIAIPRLHEYGEHVNNHQRQIVNVFNEKKYLLGIQNVEDLPEALKEINDFNPKEYKSENQKMIKTIEDYIEKI